MTDSELLAQARQAYREGRPAEARRLVEGVLRAEPSNVDALLLAADIYRVDNPSLAPKVYAQAAKLAPGRPEVPAGMAELYYAQGDAARCDQCLDAVIDLDPEYLRSFYYAAMRAAVQAVHAQGEAARDARWDFYEAIVAAYQRAQERYAVSPLVSYNMARLLVLFGEFELAKQAYQRCLDLDPEMTEAYAGMAEASLLLEQYEETIEWCALVEGGTWRTAGEEHNPDWVAAHYAAGNLSVAHAYRVEAKARLWLGQFEPMALAIRRAAEMEPWNSGDLYHDILDEQVKLGRALLENEQVVDAIKVLRTGVDIAQRMNYPALFLWLAEAYLAHALLLQAHDRSKAEAALERASQIVREPPVPLPPEARAAWKDLEARLKLEDKPSGPFGFLRR